jgi:hypothetical protein
MNKTATQFMSKFIAGGKERAKEIYGSSSTVSPTQKGQVSRWF